MSVEERLKALEDRIRHMLTQNRIEGMSLNFKKALTFDANNEYKGDVNFDKTPTVKGKELNIVEDDSFFKHLSIERGNDIFYSEIDHIYKGGASNRFFGMKVSISDDGSTIVVSDSRTGNGRVLVYSVSENDIALLTAVDNPESIVGFGEFLVLSGDGKVIMVGTRESGYSSRNRIYMFKRVVNDYNQVGTYIEEENNNALQFDSDFSISYDGSVAVVGAYQNSTVSDSGCFYVIRNNGSSVSLIAKVAGDENDYLGRAVDISYDGSMIAASSESEVRFYSVNENVVSPESYVISYGSQVNSVSFSKDHLKLAVSSPSYDDAFSNIGKVSLYDFIDSSWQHSSDLYHSVEQADMNFGSRVILSNDGKSLAVSAAGDELLTGNIYGSVSVYTLDDENVWQLFRGRINGKDIGTKYASFFDIAKDTGKLIISEHEANDSGSGYTKSGVFHFYKLGLYPVAKKTRPLYPIDGTMHVSAANGTTLTLEIFYGGDWYTDDFDVVV